MMNDQEVVVERMKVVIDVLLKSIYLGGFVEVFMSSGLHPLLPSVAC